MWPHGLLVRSVLSGWLISACVGAAAEPRSSLEPGEGEERSFAAKGVVKELKQRDSTVLVSHEAITNYMDSMTMPFKVKNSKQLVGLRAGDRIAFIGELARLSDVTFERDGASFNHNFRTLIIDTTGHLQMVFPTGGDLSEAIVEEILKAAAVTNQSVSGNAARGREHEANQKKEDPRFHGG